MTAVAFMCLEVISNKNRAVVTLSDIKDLNSSHPWMSLIMLFAMFHRMIVDLANLVSS